MPVKTPRFDSLDVANEKFALVEHAKREWETTFDAIQEGIAVLSPDGTFKRANAALARMVGMDVRELPGRSCCDIFPHHHTMGCPARIVAGHRVVEFEASTPWRRVYRESSYSVPDLGSTVAIVTDITHERLADERVRRLHAEAVGANAELSASLAALKATQERLVASEKMASLATMAAGLAHEVNNPLGFVSSGVNRVRDWIGRAVTFMDAFGKGATKSDLDRIAREAQLTRMAEDSASVFKDVLSGLERIRRIVDAISTFVDQGPVATTAIDLNDVVRTAVAETPKEAETRVALKAGELPAVEASPAAVASMLRQVLENAAFACRESGRAGRIEVQTLERAGTAVIRVKDNGIGMDAEVLRRAVDPFFTTRAPGPHVGLGLTIAQALARRMGGDLDIRSEAGAGTTVEITLPLAGGAGTRDEAPAPGSSSAIAAANRT